MGLPLLTPRPIVCYLVRSLRALIVGMEWKMDRWAESAALVNKMLD